MLALVVLLGAVGYAFYWFGYARYFEATDDAYVNGDVVQISSQEPGTVLAVHVDDTQPVAADTPLVDLDPADAEDRHEQRRGGTCPQRAPGARAVCAGGAVAGADRPARVGARYRRVRPQAAAGSAG